jgi:hypothetical protein
MQAVAKVMPHALVKSIVRRAETSNLNPYHVVRAPE